VRKPVSVLAILVLFTAALTLPAIADDSKTVNATVTPLIIALNVDPASVSYGTRPLAMTAIDADTPFNVINTGSVPEQFHIRGANSTPGGWSLGLTAGNDAYVHRFRVSTTGNFLELASGNKLLRSNVPPDSSAPGIGTIQVYLQLDMPTTTTSTVQQTLPVTVIATQQLGP
jgi:hypothetical protein